MKPDENIQTFDEEQSLSVIKEMIQVSQKKMQGDGILFIVWGWVTFINCFFLNYLTSALITTEQIMVIVRPFRTILPLLAVAFNYFLYSPTAQKSKNLYWNFNPIHLDYDDCLYDSY